ncbi:MAG: thiol reductase thioredoxin, partial [Lachnospiraceae bacterium]|nr:thiol reductase thioredoxin [Lachnospiraceae bacterium]
MAAQVFTTQNFDAEVLQSAKPVLVDFWATWCGPCQMQGPIVEELSEELTDVVVG